MKARLVDGRLQYASKIIRIGNKMVSNASDEELIKLGFKEVVETDMPEEEEGFYYSCEWKETEDSIIREWHKNEIIVEEDYE